MNNHKEFHQFATSSLERRRDIYENNIMEICIEACLMFDWGVRVGNEGKGLGMRVEGWV